MPTLQPDGAATGDGQDVRTLRLRWMVEGCGDDATEGAENPNKLVGP